MNKLRPLRIKNLSVDMTSMCDVAFLLLVFFVVTAKFKPYEQMRINLPMYSNQISDPDDNIAILHIADNKVMFEISQDDVRAQALSGMCHKYNILFSKTEQSKFLSSPIIGAPIAQLKQYDEQYFDHDSNINRPGITDCAELYNWIRESRLAEQSLHGHDLRIIIKADKDQPYPLIQQVIAILQKQNVNKFSLLTSAKMRDI